MILPPPPSFWPVMKPASPPVIEWPNALTLSIESSFDHWVVFTEPDHALCVEPQSGPPNEVNAAPTIVQPGEPLVGWMRLDWS